MSKHYAVKYSVLPVSKHHSTKIPDRLMQGLTHCHPRMLSSLTIRYIQYISNEYKHTSITGLTYLRIQWVPGTFTALVKRLGCEADPSPPYSEVRNEWSYTSNTPLCLPGMHRDNCIFYVLHIMNHGPG
jgi:hypothetical protein